MEQINVALDFIKKGIELGLSGQIDVIDLDMEAGPTKISVAFTAAPKGIIVEADIYHSFDTPYPFESTPRSFHSLLTEIYEKALDVDDIAMCFVRCHVFGDSAQPDHYFYDNVIHYSISESKITHIETHDECEEATVRAAFAASRLVL